MYKCMVIRRVIHVHCVHCSIPVDLRYSTIISYNSYCKLSMKEHIPCYTVELLTGQGVAVFGQQMTKHTLPCVFIWHPHIHTFNKPPVSGKKKLYIETHTHVFEGSEYQNSNLFCKLFQMRF